MTPRSRALWQIHFCVVLWGFTAILGKLIELPALPLVSWRMLIVSALLLCVPHVWRGLRAMPARRIGLYLAIGVVVALHWLGFYASIKLANASVAATCMAVGPVFLAVIEPVVMRRRFDVRELLFGLAIVPGVVLVLGGVPGGMVVGFGVGVISAAFVALFGALNKRHAHHADPLCVTCLEMGGGAIVMCLTSLFWPHTGGFLPIPGGHDALLLLILAVGCTLLPFALSLVALRELTAFSVQLAVNLEPVYAVILAILLLGEQKELGAAFYGGVAIIVAAVLLHPLLVPERAVPADPPAGPLID